MNEQDDFLRRLRKDPPPDFLQTLKGRLDRIAQDEGRHTIRRPSRSLRTLLAGILIGASALALASLAFDGNFGRLRSLIQSSQSLFASGADEQSRDGKWVAPQHPDVPGSLNSAWTFAGRPTPPVAAGRTGNDAKNRTGSAANALVPGAGAADSSQVQYVESPSTNVVVPRTNLRILSVAALEPSVRSLAQTIVHNLGTFGSFKMPDIAVAQTSAALASLCKPGADSPEFVAVSRRVSDRESQACAAAKTGPAIGMTLGYQTAAIVRNRLTGAPDLTGRQLYLALADRLPDPTNPRVQVRNPYTSWNQIDPALGYDAIRFIGPDPKSTVGQAVLALLMAPGCATSTVAAATLASDTDQFEQTCGQVRTDAAYEIVPISRGSKAIVDRLAISPASIGIIGPNEKLMKGAVAWLLVGKIDGIAPTPETIAAGSYPATNTLYVYLNRAALVRSNILREQAWRMLDNFSFWSDEREFTLGLTDAQRDAMLVATDAQLRSY